MVLFRDILSPTPPQSDSKPERVFFENSILSVLLMKNVLWLNDNQIDSQKDENFVLYENSKSTSK